MAVCNIAPPAETNAYENGCLEIAPHDLTGAYECASGQVYDETTTDKPSSFVEQNLMRHTAYLSFIQPGAGGSEVC